VCDLDPSATLDLWSDLEFQAESFGAIPIVVRSKLWLLEPSEVTHVARQKIDLFDLPMTSQVTEKGQPDVF